MLGVCFASALWPSRRGVGPSGPEADLCLPRRLLSLPAVAGESFRSSPWHAGARRRRLGEGGISRRGVGPSGPEADLGIPREAPAFYAALNSQLTTLNSFPNRRRCMNPIAPSARAPPIQVLGSGTGTTSPVERIIAPAKNGVVPASL